METKTTSTLQRRVNRKCERLDKEIDQLVYQLYNLTEEKIKIEEGNK